MADTYYLMSKDTGDGPHLIGALKQLRKGDYQFRYMIRGDRFPAWFLQIPGFRDVSRIYGTQEVTRWIMNRLVPVEGAWAADIVMKQNNIKKYDPWALLESLVAQYARCGISDMPLCDSHQLFYFYNAIPANANRYDG